MSITSVVNDTVTSVSVLNAQKPLPPTITNYSVGGVDDTALDPAGGQTVQINGTGFLAGATITFDGNAVAVVTYVSPNQLSFTSPAKSAGTYTIYVVNPDGGTAIYIPGIIYSVLPTWTTGAGTLGSYYETQSISNTVVASGDAPITYSLFSGSLPTGASLAANGVITGTAPVDSSSTTYSFTIQATDAQLQDSTRSFSLTINTDVVTWVSPANATTYTSAVDSAIANVTLDATDAAGYAVTYSANALPTGLSLSGANISGTPTVIADSSTLLTATAATTNRTATRTINWSITVANDPYFEYNTLLIPGASTTFVDDASTNNFAVTVLYDTKPNNSNPYTPGYYSNYFNNGSPYLRATTNSAFNFGTGDFTVEFWYYSVSIGADARFISNEPYSGSGIDISYESGSSRISWYISYASYNTATLPTANKWHHIAYTRTGTTLYVYVDGIKVNTYSSFTANITSANSLTIGGNSAGGATLDGGYISNLRLVKGVSVYSTGENFTPPTTPLTAISGTSLLTCQSNRFIDNSTNNFTLTVNGNTTVNSFDPFVPNTSYSSYGSGYFDGTGDYLSVPGNSVFAFGTGDFTIEVWLYANSISTGSFDRICATSDYNGSGFDWTLNTNSSGFYLAGTSYNIGSITPNVWHHLVYTRSGSVIRGFLNGKLSSYTTGASQNITSTSNLNIGVGYSGTYLNGYLVDLRIIKGSIPAGYQTSSTTTGTQIFTPPTAPLTAIANTSLLTLQNNQSVNNSVFLDNSTNNFLVTRAGNTTQGTFSPYGGNYSNYFDGTGDYLTIANNSNLSWTGNTDGSMEAWVYITSSSATGTILSKSDISGSSYPNYAMAIVTGGYLNGYVGQSGFPGTGLGGVTSATAIPLNTWAHVLFTRKYVGGASQNEYRIFVNGVLRGFTTNESPSDSRAGNCVVGGISGGGSYFSGYISNLRFFNNSIPVAYQTSSQTVGTTIFTPSTTPLVMVTGTQLLTCQSNRLIDNSINNFSLTKSGDTSVQRFSPFNPSTVTPTSYSGYFDGTGDYLSLPNATGLNPSTGDFTFECWVYALSTAVEWSLFEGVQNGLGVGLNASKQLTISQSYVSYLISDTVTMTTNSWIHVCAVRSGTTMSLYKNGSRVATGTNSTNFTTNSTNYIGYSGSAALPGYISNLRLVKGTAVYDPTSTTITVPTTPLTAIANTALLTCQSPTFIDNSTNNFTITANGNSQPTIQNPFGYTSATANGYTPSTIGGSGYFDGTGDYLTVPSNTAFYLSTGNWTIEAWIYKRTANKQIIVAQSQNNGAPYAGWTLYVDNSSLIVFEGTNGALIGSPTVTVPLNAWTHIAVVKSSSTVTIYQNGVSVNSGGAPSVTDYNTVLAIGNYSSYVSGADWNGYISDLRIVKGTALYTSNFVPPASPILSVQNTSLLTNMTSAGIYDASMMNNIETVGDAKLSTAVSKFGSSSMYFDGSGDYLFSPTANVNNLSKFLTSNFTVECWIYPTTSSGDRTIISAVLVWGAGANYNIEVRSGLLHIQLGNGVTMTSGSISISANTWTHIALVRSSATSTTVYVNGVSSATYTSSWTADEDCPLTIGCFNENGGALANYWQGYIDDLRITKGYARYTSNFTPPTTPFPVY